MNTCLYVRICEFCLCVCVCPSVNVILYVCDREKRKLCFCVCVGHNIFSSSAHVFENLHSLYHMGFIHSLEVNAAVVHLLHHTKHMWAHGRFNGAACIDRPVIACLLQWDSKQDVATPL